MSDVVVKVENVSKQYRLGEIGTGTLSHDLNRWWAKVRGKEDPYSLVGDVNDRAVKSSSDYVWALRDINLEVKRGDILGIIGKNGAGKSTILKILSRVTGPTTGRVAMKGRVGSLLEVGTGMHPEMTARENIYLNGAILGMMKNEVSKKFDDIIDFAGVGKYVDTPIKRYSSGMKVRLGFAVAAFLEPEILIVDEVLAVGDAEFQKRCIGKMQDISKGEGRTILFVSHNMASVVNLCKSAVVIEMGEISFRGSPEAAVSNYVSNQSVSSYEELEAVTNRKGSQDVLISSVNFIEVNSGQSLSMLFSGQSVKMCIELRKRVESAIEDLEIGISFYNSNKELMFACLSSAIGKTYHLNKTKTSIILHFEKWPTSGGLYSYNILVKAKNTLLDWIVDAGSISVENGNFFGTGKLPAQTRQSVLINYNYL